MENLSINEIYLTKRNKIILPPYDFGVHYLPGKSCSINQVASFTKNLESLGFIVSNKLFQSLQALSIDQLEDLYKEIIPILKKMVGAHVKFDPMYPNFPKQVMEASDLELFLNAITHYWGSFIHDVTDIPVRILPDYKKDDRAPLLEKTSLRLIDLGNEEDFNSIFTQLVSSNSSISDNDKEIVRWFIKSYKDRINDILPANIPQKEQLALVASELLTHTKSADPVGKYIKTATDVLRIAVALSKGDVSLATPCKFIKFNRPTRRFLLNLLEGCGSTANTTEDMLRWKDRWIRLGEVLHPTEYRNRCPKVCEIFDILRNNLGFVTFNSSVEYNLQYDIDEAVNLLKDRPGDFARRLDHIFRLSGGENYRVASQFLDVADKVSTPVLLQTYSHFKNRNRNKVRTFFPKGNVAKAQVVPNDLIQLDDSFINLFTYGLRNKLIDRFRKLPKLGKVYLDKNLKNYIVPFSQRSSSKSLRTIARGSKVKFGDGNTLRFFLWWKDGKSRTDIDLSNVAYTKDWKKVELAYYNLIDNELGLYHSGDITSAPNGACEFIDINIQKLIDNNYRYLVMVINSFTQQPFVDLPECFAGWMLRERPQSGEVFEPKTVLDKIDLTANTKIAIPVVIDLASRQIIWTDLSLKNRSIFNNTRNNQGGIELMVKGMIQLDKPNLYDLLFMHVKGRATEVLTSPEGADIVFSEHEGITPYDQDKILSEFLI